MSYEGYDQRLCANGHLIEVDAYDYAGQDAVCHCGASWVWENSVNLTNGSFDTDSFGYETDVRIDGYVEMSEYLLIPPATHTCSCGHEHVVMEATYSIPPEGIGRRIVPETK